MRQADVVLHGGRVLTMADSAPRVSGLAVVGDRIAAVGTDDEILDLVGPATDVVDLHGRTVIPGLIDSHTHLELTACSRHHWLDVRDMPADGVVDTVRSLAAARPAGTWIILQGTFGQQLPDKVRLDAAAPDHPVAVRWSMHKFQLNSCALALAGINRRTIAPPGSRIHFDMDGIPTGLVEEGWDLINWQPPLAEALRESIRETAKSLFLRHGVTTIHEIAASAAGLAAYQQIARGDEVLPRFGIALTAAPGHQPLITAGTFAGIGLRTGFGGPKLRLAAVKIFVDGGRDGALRTTGIAGPAGQWGMLTRTPQQLAMELTETVGAGLQTWIHAIGDMAQELTVSAIEQMTRVHPGADHRTRIEHFGNELFAPERLARLVAAGGIPAPNPSFVYAEPDDPERRLPPGATKYGLRTLLSSGARPPGNSDTGGAQPFACNPWFTMQSMIERRNRNGVEINPEESITITEALRAFTVDAAVATFCEDDRGTLEPGKYADLAILTANPLEVPTTQLATVTSELTMVGGRFATTDSATSYARVPDGTPSGVTSDPDSYGCAT